jgi:hypothetical protein
MSRADRPLPARPALSRLLVAALGLVFLCPPASAQDRAPATLRLDGVGPAGVRDSATDSWQTFEFDLTNLTDAERAARVVLLFEGRPGEQYARDVWVPARSTVRSWMLVGPAVAQHAAASDIEVLLYDRTDGTDRLVLPPEQERVRSRPVFYKPRVPYTAVLLDDDPPEEDAAGRLPWPDSASTEALRLVRTFRQAGNPAESVRVVRAGALPPVAEAFDPIDQFVLASERIRDDPAGLRALRQWLERGGRVWVMLDRVGPEAVAALLGDAPDFRVVDRVGLTDFRVETRPGGRFTPPPLAERHERPVDFVRVLLPPGERAPHTVNGWPAWFTRPVGRGKVVFTALGPRAWYRDRKPPADPPSPDPTDPSLPVAADPLGDLAAELRPPEEDPIPADAFRPMLAEEIGYSVVGRGAVALVFGASLLAALAAGLVLRRARRRELLGWLGPTAALGAAAAFVGLGEWSRQASPATVAVAEVVDAVPGADEAPVRGLLAVYRPDSGPVEIGSGQGGRIELDLAGVEGQTPRLRVTDLDAWQWDNLSLPAGVHFGAFHYTAPTGGPVAAVAHFGPEGVEGRLTAGAFRGLGDAVLATPEGRNLAVRLDGDGAFRAGEADALPAGQYLAAAVLSDRQQRRQEAYREHRRRSAGRAEGRSVLLAWADPLDLRLTPAPAARTVGGALLAVPLRWERPAPGERVTVPGPFVACRRLFEAGPTLPTREGGEAADMHLRFQLPAEALPLRVERAVLLARINAPSRRVAVSGRSDGGAVELLRVESPLDPLRVEIADERLLRLDDQGGLHVNLSVGDDLRGGGKWTIEYLELEVGGRAE